MGGGVVCAAGHCICMLQWDQPVQERGKEVPGQDGKIQVPMGPVWSWSRGGSTLTSCFTVPS